MTISLTQTTTSSIQQGAERAMKTSNLTLKPLCSCLLLGLLAYLAFLASFSAAETHYHEFVVCFFFHSPCTSFYFKRVKWTWFKIISIFSLTFFCVEWNRFKQSQWRGCAEPTTLSQSMVSSQDQIWKSETEILLSSKLQMLQDTMSPSTGIHHIHKQFWVLKICCKLLWILMFATKQSSS